MTTNRPRWTTLLALILVPLLAAGALLAGTWNYDQRARRVQAAVVNLDEAVTLNGRTVPLGRQLTAALVDSDREQNFTWVLADVSHARSGLATGTYAAVVTIPKNFSAAATSSSKKAADAHQATIQVETSPVAGIADTALGQSIADAAASSLNDEITRLYLDNVYLGFNKMGEQMVSIADGARQLSDGSAKLSDGVGQAATGSTKLADGLGQLASGSDQLVANSGRLTSGARQLSDGLAQLKAGTDAMPGQLGQLSSGANQLADGVGQVAGGLKAYAGGVRQYVSGVREYGAGVDRYTDGVATYVGGVNQLLDPIIAAVESLPDLSSILPQLHDWALRLPDIATSIDRQVQAIAPRLKELIRSSQQLSAGASTLSTRADAHAAEVRQLASGSGVACPASLQDVQGGCAAFAAGVKAAGQEALGGASGLSKQADALVAKGEAVGTDADQLVAAIEQAQRASAAFAKNAPDYRDRYLAIEKQLQGGPSQSQLLGSLKQLRAGGDQLFTGGRQLDQGAGKLAAGADQLASGADRLAAGADALGSGARRLADGVRKLVDGLGALSTGVGRLADGAAQLSSGLDQYAAGVAKVSGGIRQSADGAGALANGLGDAAKGADRLASGAGKLADGVASGAKQIPSYDKAERENLAKVVAQPISRTGLDALVTPRLALASLLLVLALWLGAAATFGVLKPVDEENAYSGAPTSRLVGWALLPGMAIVGAQGLLLAVIGQVALRLPFATSAAIAGVLVLAGVVFAVANHALVAWWGTWGRLASLALLLLGLVPALSAAAPGWLVALRPLSPVAPALDAVREIATGHSPALALLALLGWGAVALLASWLAIARSRTVPASTLVEAG